MQISHYYNIHDVLQMKIQRQRRFPDLFRDINLRFSYFEVDHADNPSLIINIGKFKPQMPECKFVDHQYHVGDGYFYCRDKEKIAKWEFEISGIEDEVTTLNFDGSILGLHEIVYPHIFAQNMIGRFLIQYKLGLKNYFMIHAASVVKDGNAFVFAGRGGANKTSIIMDLVRNYDFTFQGDDWIVFKDNSIYSFPAHFQEFNFRANVLPSEHLRGNLDRFRLFQYLRRPFDYQNSGVKVQKDGKLKTLNILLKTNNEKLKIKKNVDKELIRNMLYYNNRIENNGTSLSMGLELKGISRYLLGYSFINPKNAFQRYWKDFHIAIERLLADVSCNIIEVPDKYDKSVTKEICSLFLDD
ncbi:MAG TPA: hypothetical protein ENH82_17150 [bacterium]|nr:hypothetical protein [bacterium]